MTTTRKFTDEEIEATCAELKRASDCDYLHGGDWGGDAIDYGGSAEAAAEQLRSLLAERLQLQQQVADLAYEIGMLRHQHEVEKRALAERVKDACSLAVIPSMDVGEARDLIASVDLYALLASEPPKEQP